IEALERVLPLWHRAPVGHDVALVAPAVLEHLVQKVVISASVLAVDPVVAAHDRAGLRALDRDLECEQVGLAVGRGIDDRIEPVAVGLVAVERVVLERGDDALALDAVDGLGAEDGAEPRIFGVVLEVRPLRTSRARLIPPASMTLKPRIRASRAIA